MDSSIALSVGSCIGLVGMFYTWHKDSKETAKQIQKLETEVEQLREQRQDIRELKEEINGLKITTSEINQTLVRIDTNVQHLMSN